MQRSRLALLIVLIVAVAGFGYSQYASASQIGAEVVGSQVIEQGVAGSKYSVQLEFENPSLLYLTAGQTEFTIYAGDQNIGYGTLMPFVLPAMSSTTADGTFTTSAQGAPGSDVRISGTTSYDIGVTTIDVPFVFYPTGEQAREFIQTG